VRSVFTGKTTHNLGIDADFITVDAGAGIDNAAAGALKIGESTATSIEIADTGVATAVEGALTVASTLAVTGASTLSDTLAVRGVTTLDNVISTGTLAVAETALISGNTTLNGTLTMLTNKFTVAATGNTVVGGTLTANGALTQHGAATFGAGITHTGTLFRTATTQMVFTAAASAAATNAATASILIQINGTNYYLNAFPAND
jgi:hypothetical protein